MNTGVVRVEPIGADIADVDYEQFLRCGRGSTRGRGVTAPYDPNDKYKP